MATATQIDVPKTRLPWLQLLPQKAVAILRRMEVNRAVFFSVLTQGWSALAGPATMLVIAHWLTAVEQGFYYTFSSVLALQVFVELGLVTVIVQVASHEWAFLKREPDGRISGDLRALSRLASLLRFALKWYAVSGLLVIVGLSVGGFIFFSAKPHPEIAWQLPWFALCGIAGVALMMSPIFSVIEGCNQVASIYSFRFTQGILNSLAVIVSLLLGLGLYALAVAALVRFMCGLTFIGWKHRVFILQILTTEITERINWRGEVWPFQWRIGVSWISGYFIFSIFTPVMFYYHGPKVAGQMGMTWAMVASIEMLSYAWINTRMPQFGMFIAQRQYTALDRLFRRVFWITLVIAGAGAVGLWGLIYGLHHSRLSLSERILPLLPVTLLLLQRIINVSVSAMAFYLRAHKREPLMLPSLISAVLIGFSTWILGAYYGPTGAAVGFLCVTLVWTLPACYGVFQRCQTLWHEVPTSHSVRGVVTIES
jgi:O-antigen/teichoic acid export membrane protein